MVTVVKEKTAAKKTNTRESFVRKRGNALKQETQNELERFRDYLREQEKSSHTIEKYCRDVRKFLMFADEDWDKNTIISFKEYLQAHYKTSSANSMLASLNSYFHFIGRQEYCVRTFRVQKRIFCDERQEMTRSDYQKLVKAARERGDERLCAILQTIASTGIRQRSASTKPPLRHPRPAPGRPSLPTAHWAGPQWTTAPGRSWCTPATPP